MPSSLKGGLFVGAIAVAMTLHAAADARGAVCTPSLVCQHGFQTIDARRLAARANSGNVVVERCLRVRGDLAVGGGSVALKAPVVITYSCIEGDVVGRSSRFESILDLSHSTIAGSVDFYSADFNRVVNWRETHVQGTTTFSAAEFGGQTDFYEAEFSRPASFRSAYFERESDFGGATFDREATFSDASFGDEARFAFAQFLRDASFVGTQFAGRADFSGAQFGRDAEFNSSTAHRDIGFERTQFQGSTTQFKSVLYDEEANFSDAGQMSGNAIFDQASIHFLDIRGAQPYSLGHLTRIDELQIDPSTVARLQLKGDRGPREQQYRQIETAARHADDLSGANEAKIHRKGLERSGDWVGWRELQLFLFWEVGGYLVSPVHPIVAILLALALAAAARFIARIRNGHGRLIPRSMRAARSSASDTGRSAVETFKALRPRRQRRSRRPRRGVIARLESVVYVVLVVVLLLNFESVSPLARRFLEGLL